MKDNVDDDCVILMLGNKCDLDEKPPSSFGLNSTTHSRNPTFEITNNSLLSDASFSYSRIKSARSGDPTISDDDLLNKMGARQVPTAEA